MKQFLYHIYIIAAILIVGYAVFKYFDTKNIKPNDVKQKTDTVLVREVHHWHETNNNTATKVIIQEKKDTSYRKQVEKETIITSVKIKDGEVGFQKVDTAGVVTEEYHKIEEGSTVTITNSGVNEKKRTKAGSFLRKAGKVGLRTLEVIGVAAVLIFITK